MNENSFLDQLFKKKTDATGFAPLLGRNKRLKKNFYWF